MERLMSAVRKLALQCATAMLYSIFALAGVVAVHDIFWPSVAKCQTTHTVKITWTDTINPAGTTYNVYRAAAACSTTPTLAKLTSGLTTMTYTDSAVTN